MFSLGKTFIDRIDTSKKNLLIFHRDGDGYCSGAIFLSAMEKLGKRECFDTSPSINSEVESTFKDGAASGYDKIVILDVDVPYLKSDFEKFKGEILIIDHHTIREDFGENVIYINPRLDDEKLYQPVSYVVYKMLSSFISMKDVEWVSVLGTVSDFAFEDCKDLLSNHLDITKKDEIPSTHEWKVSKMLYSAIILDVPGIIDVLLKHNSLNELENDDVIKSAFKKFEEEQARVEEDFWNNAEKFDNVIISRIVPRYKRVASSISTKVSLENKDKIILVLEKVDDMYKISARYQNGGVHLGKLMEKCCISGGGHMNAAGGIIQIEDYESFKKCVASNIDD